MNEKRKEILFPSVVVRVKIEAVETGFHIALIDESNQEGNWDMEIPELPGVTLNNSRWYSYRNAVGEFGRLADYLETKIVSSLIGKSTDEFPQRIILVMEK